MSDDEDNTNFYGTALPELPNDVIPTRKPITVADQIAVDANGKRRFHGAFTGGFSAGYWNTVGSQEGWKPKEFKSSRTEKASRVQQNPNDFMDEEDCGEFGINPQRIQTTDDFTAGDATKAGRGGEDAAGANPMLNLFLMPARDRASVALLKRMGWRENKDGKSYRSHSTRKSQAKVYQCSMGPFQAATSQSADDDDDGADDSDASCESVTFNPDDFEALAHAPKTNRFGIGYRGLIGSDRSTSLEQTSASRHVNLFAPSFEVVDRKTQKKLTVRGQAFGVGAFEEDDDDIYALDDMSTYSFEQKGAKRSRDQCAALNAAPVKYHQTIAGFKPADAQSPITEKRVYTVPMPRDFRPRNWLQRKTRFEPRRDEPKVTAGAPNIAAGMGRHMLTPDQRGQLLGTASAKVQPVVVPMAAKTVEAKPAKPMTETSDRARKMLESFDSRFVSVAASAAPTPAETLKTGLQNIADIRLAEQLYSKQFVSAEPSAVLDSKTTATAAATTNANAATASATAYEVYMTRELITWQPCPLLYQKMNVEDPSRALAGSKTAAAAPFSLMKHVNPLFRSSRTNEKEFTASSRLAETDVVPNAYVPKVTPTITQAPPPLVTSIPEVAVTAVSVKVPIHQPKTELEQSISKAANAHPSEKKDIFKAIFESSDEENDDDNDAAAAVDKQAAVTGSTTTDEPMTGRHRFQSLPSAAITANILRNTSPPRGIFSTLSKIHPSSALAADDSAAKSPPTEQTATISPDVYGPTLPSAPTPASSRPSTESTRRPEKRSNASSTDSSDSDEWIVSTAKPADRSSGGGTSDRHRKKHKKDKSRHKDKKAKKSKKCKKDKKHKR